MSGIFVTEFGFQKKTLATLKAEEEAKFKSQFGDNINLDPQSPFGQIIGLNVKAFAELWDALQEIYTSRNIFEATGYSLDAIVGETGTIRQPATQTIAYDVSVFGTENSVIPAGTKVKRTDSDENYSLVSSVTISKNNLIGAKFEIIEPNNTGDLYSLIINGIQKNYTIPSPTPAHVIWTNLRNQFVGTDEFDLILPVLAGSSFLYLEAISSNNYLPFTANHVGGQDVELATPGQFLCDEFGEIYLPLNTLTDIITPASGLIRVNNLKPGVTGREIESDADLRLRQQSSLNIGLAVEGAILRNILEVPGVSDASVDSNRTMSALNGLPPKSFECVVNGGDIDQVATAIWLSMPAGIESHGINQAVTIVDSQGNDQLIKFSTPVGVFLHVEITISKYSEEVYPTDGDNLMKENVVEFAKNELKLGDDVIPQRFNQPIYEVPGVGQTQIRCALTANAGDTPVFPTVANKDLILPIDNRTISVLDVSRISVQEF